MILDTHNRSLQILLGEVHATKACDLTACYAQANAAGSFVTSLNHTASNGTSAVTIVPAPGVGLQFMVNEVRCHNSDTVGHNVILRLLDGSTTRIVYTGVVQPGADWVYTPEVGAAGSGGSGGSAGVSSFNTRTGAVTLLTADVTGAGGAPIASPSFTGTVTIPGGSINATTVGATTASAGAFTTLSASGLITPTSNVGIKGTGTNDNAAAGSIGEYVVSNTSVAVSTGVAANITTISLTAGDWDVSAVVGFNNASASATQLGGGVSTTSATLPGIGQLGLAQLATPSATINNATQIAIAPTRFIVSATTTVYLVGIAAFASGTTNLYGTIRARRMR